ncbi:GatB/YqeY domain-containing protein [Glaciecola sp. 1036]|uniref:GatB/YqeY domain-containing protein n=1 Tax=Alteromonadaceae TaxID=72275 RepID=UPI003D000B7C
MSLLLQLKDAQKDAMRAKDKLTLGTLRMALAAVKQKEVDERVEVTDEDVLQILTKLIKQRQEAATQFEKGNRQDLADQEKAEIEVLQKFLPEQLSDDEIKAIVEKAIADTGADNIRDMGKVMGKVKPQLQGRADMGKVSGMIKGQLS